MTARAPVRHVFDFAARSGDSHDMRVQKRLQVAMAVLSIPVVGLWGLLFVVEGHAQYAVWQLGYCLGTAGMLAFLAVTKRFDVFRVAHPILVMLAPFALHLHLGGFRGSGGALFWSMLAPIAAVMFGQTRHSWRMFAALIALALFGWFREVYAPPATYALSLRERSFHFAFNTIGFIAFLFVSTRYFVTRIEREKARSERLLLNVLPPSVAERLKRDEGVIADRFESATVLFTDIVGFTPLAAKLEAHELVHLLDEIFSAFDAIADRRGLEKIKTIGDAYMLVGGVPDPNPEHAALVAEAALEIREYVARFAHERGLDVSMRIGMHSGEVVAGVIGRRKFTYDLWGDTVNTASRMESHGAAGKIHVSDAAAARLRDGFALEERGAVTVKGKGEMQTFWLVGKKAGAG
jgi:guanylate cyclase